MKHKKLYLKKWLTLISLSLVFILSGCGEMRVLEPKGPVAESQRDLIMYSIWFMLGIIVVVFALFAYMVIKYRDRPGRGDKDYDPDIHGNTTIEIIWTIIPFIIVILLSIPTVDALYELEKPPETSAAQAEAQDPLVIHATSADWKWFFSYPEQGIETVNYLHIPTDRPIEFKLTSADSMAALWIPSLGGQKYNMAGMMNTLYLEADEEGVYAGRNANFTGEGFTKQTFEVHAESTEEFNQWIEKTQTQAPKLTQDQYNELLKPGLLDELEFSSTHLQWVNHAKDADYAIERHPDAYDIELHLENNNAEVEKHNE